MLPSPGHPVWSTKVQTHMPQTLFGNYKQGE